MDGTLWIRGCWDASGVWPFQEFEVVSSARRRSRRQVGVESLQGKTEVAYLIPKPKNRIEIEGLFEEIGGESAEGCKNFSSFLNPSCDRFAGSVMMKDFRSVGAVVDQRFSERARLGQTLGIDEVFGGTQIHRSVV